MRLFFLVALLLSCKTAFSQSEGKITGTVKDENGQPVENALFIFLPGGSHFFSDSIGRFEFEKPAKATMLVVSASGFLRDTLSTQGKNIHVILKESGRRSPEIQVSEMRNPGQIDFKSASLNLKIDRQELRKAACCNLSESFETSPMVDVSFPDPISGTRQIQMLGLAGQYSGYSFENQSIPNGILGAAASGLIPGPWLESIQVQKGIGSVSSGYSALAGQINSNFLAADSAAKTEINGFVSSMGRLEANLVTPLRKSAEGGTQVFLHANNNLMDMDFNRDGYRDFPRGFQGNAMLRSSHRSGKNGIVKLALQTYRDQRTGGSLDFKGNTPSTFPGFGFFSDIAGLELSGKTGFVLPGNIYRSIGLPFTGGWRENQQLAGKNEIKLKEKYFSFDPVWQCDLGRRGSGLKAGLSWAGRSREEILHQLQYMNVFRRYSIQEQRIGGFAEYNLVLSPGLLMVAGTRADFHNLYGWRHSPRMHLRYESDAGLVMRVSAGQAWQDPEIFSQHLNYFFSGRKMELQGSDFSLPYGLKAEKGRSIGLSATYSYRILPGRGSFLAEGYLNKIDNQVIADAESSGILRFYNARVPGNSNTLALQFDQNFGRQISLRMAYRYSASWLAYQSGTMARPLLAFHRAFLHLDVKPGKNYQVNSTLNLNGPKRLYGGHEKSPAFVTIQGQLSKTWSNGMELAFGVENLGNFRQKVLIISPDSPQNPEFDAARVWGPATGTMVYCNFRLHL